MNSKKTKETAFKKGGVAKMFQREDYFENCREKWVHHLWFERDQKSLTCKRKNQQEVT